MNAQTTTADSHAHRAPRAPRQGQYTMINAYTQPFAIEQILTFIAFLLIITLHSIFIAPGVSYLANPILWVIFATTYAFVILLFYDYIILTNGDPVDRLITGEKNAKDYRLEQLVECKLCRRVICKKSYHCMRCNRCTENFDHHCRYLNNCIGGLNYTNFMRLLITATAFCIVIIGQGVWVFTKSYSDDNFNEMIITRWMVLVTIIFVAFILFSIQTLLVFHIYITCYRKMTTYDYIYRDTSSNASSSVNDLQRQNNGLPDDNL